LGGRRLFVTTDSRSLPSASPQAQARSARGRRLVFLCIVGLLSLAYAGFELWTRSRPYEWSGTVEARTISVGSRVGGRVLQIRVKEGDRVLVGQVLLELEPGDLPAQRLMAKGQLDQAQASLEKAKKGARPEEIEEARARAQTAAAALQETRIGARTEQIAAAHARYVAAQVAADKAKLDADRAEKLFASSSISRGQLDDAEATLNGASAQREAARQELEELQNGSRHEDIVQATARAAEARANAQLVAAGSRIEDIEAAEAEVEAAQGKLDQVDVMLAELQIRSPRPARVESLDLRPGDILGPNATAATLIEDDQLYVRIYVPETQIGHIHPGQDVPIRVDSFPNRTFRGKVEHINAEGEYSPRNLQTADERADQVFAARIGVSEGEPDLRAGMAAFIDVPK
jgi:HlyD family secretion protein